MVNTWQGGSLGQSAPYFSHLQPTNESAQCSPVWLYVLEHKVLLKIQLKLWGPYSQKATEILSLTASFAQDYRGSSTSPKSIWLGPGICRLWVWSHVEIESILWAAQLENDTQPPPCPLSPFLLWLTDSLRRALSLGGQATAGECSPGPSLCLTKSSV